ncbi:MAG: hypothetical protein IKY83_00715 [Proteobacteria bacterium]|nr:hypothetical protein [Pseudomonadota bacterium]
MSHQTITHIPHTKRCCIMDMRLALLTCAIMAFALPPASASAEDSCDTLSSNKTWSAGITELIQTMKADDMQKAKQQAKALTDICPNAPMLNYMQGKIAESLGEKTEALYYYQKASENTYHFAVEPENAKKIWYTRYETEHPERTASAVTTNSDYVSSLESEIAELKKINHAQQISDTQKLMWTGVGLGIGGLVITGTGLGIVMNQAHKYETKKLNSDNPDVQAYTFSTTYTAGWAFIGVGATLTVTGAILAGIFGSRYAAYQKDSDYSFALTPTSASFTFNF